MGEHEVGDVARGPLVEEAGVAVLALGIDPHVETLGHDHHAQRVAEVHLQLRGHVVGGADSIAPHLLHHLDLTDEGGFVDGGSEGAEVVVQTHALELARNAIELESAFLRATDGTDAEGLREGIERSFALLIADAGFIKIRCLGCPEVGVRYLERQFGGSEEIELAVVALGHDAPLSVEDIDLEGELLIVLATGTYADIDHSLGRGYLARADKGLPRVEPMVASGDERDGAVDACTRVPA